MTRTIKKLLVIAKRSAYDMYVGHHNNPHLQALLRSNDQSVQNMMERHAAHQKALATCHELLDRWKLQWVSVRRDELQGSISGVDLVLSVGGDGTVLEASHFLGHQIPLLGVNSDPTSPTEVASKQAEYDATRSTGHLCAATSDTLPLILEEILAGHRECVEVARIATSVGGGPMPPALNDVLAAHPNPAAVTRCSYQILKEQPQPSGSPAAETLPQDSDPGSPTTPASPLVHSRSSGLRVCTATGATAAMRSGGGRPMAALSRELQFKVREPIEAAAAGAASSASAASAFSRGGDSSSSSSSSGGGRDVLPGACPLSSVESAGPRAGNALNAADAFTRHGGSGSSDVGGSNGDGDGGGDRQEGWGLGQASLGLEGAGYHHGFLGDGATLRVWWRSRQGRVYLDGCHLSREVALGEQIDISNRAPPLRMFLKGR